MGLLEPWVCDRCKGSAKSASDKLDAKTIIAGCDDIIAMVSNLNEITAGINDEGSSITKYILRVDENNVEQSVEECVTGMTKTINQIQTKATAAKNKATSEYNKIQREYNDRAEKAHKDQHEKEDEEKKKKK